MAATERLEIPGRGETIRAFQAEGGAGFAAVYPIHYPRELFRAHGLLPVEVWGPPGFDETAGAAHLQAYTCPVVRRGLSFLMSGALDGAAAVVVPHCCDSLQGLGSILLDFFAGATPPVLPFYLPRSAREADAVFLAAELGALAARLAELTGLRPGEAELRAATLREEEADALLAELHRQKPAMAGRDLDFYRLVRSRERLPAERFADLARAALDQPRDAAPAGVPILLSGIVPEPMAGLFEALEEIGARVVGDDLAACGRRLYPRGRSQEPFRRMAERILFAPPDPMRGSSIAERASFLGHLVASSGARGVVFYDVKFCEPELFDLPALRAALGERGTPSVAVEVDLSGELPGGTLTRLEAFVEMLQR